MVKWMQACWVGLFCGCSLGPDALPQLDQPQLERRSYHSPSGLGTRDYWVYLPAGYRAEPRRQWPLLLFLHGDGERGEAGADLAYVLSQGPLYEAWIAHKPLPFILVAPQMPLWGRDKIHPYLAARRLDQVPRRTDQAQPSKPFLPLEMPMARRQDWADWQGQAPLPPDGWERMEADLLQILQEVQAQERVDPRRIYLSGISYGGFGCWFLGSRHGETFAAMAPVVGWGHPQWMPGVAKARLPVWQFAAGRDAAVPISHFYEGMRLLESFGQSEVRFTVHEDAAHDAWQRIYAGDDLYTWLLQHSR